MILHNCVLFWCCCCCLIASFWESTMASDRGCCCFCCVFMIIAMVWSRFDFFHKKNERNHFKIGLIRPFWPVLLLVLLLLLLLLLLIRPYWVVLLLLSLSCFDTWNAREQVQFSVVVAVALADRLQLYCCFSFRRYWCLTVNQCL